MWLEPAIRRGIAIVIMCACTAPSAAQTWPARPVRVIVPFPPGGGLDFVARTVMPKLSELLGGSIVIDNRTGGSGMLGAEIAAHAPKDGYTLFTSAPEFAINTAVRPKLPYDAFKDFAYVTQLTTGQFMLASHPSVPVRTVRQFIALAKAQPGKVTYASSGSGGINHLSGELLGSMAGIRWVHIPFKGAGPSLIGLMGGEIDFMFASTTALVDQTRAGRVRAIAVTGTKRYAGLPELPTIAESGVPGYSVTGWYGMYAPAGTPAEILRRLHVETVRALHSLEIKENLAKTGNEAVGSSPEEFTAFVRAEIAKWAKVAKESGLRMD